MKVPGEGFEPKAGGEIPRKPLIFSILAEVYPLLDFLFTLEYVQLGL
jgi:hypothetical protein